MNFCAQRLPNRMATPQTLTLLRPGGLTRQTIEATSGPLNDVQSNPDAPIAPGQLTSHYAPTAKVRLNAETPRGAEAYLGFGPHQGVEAEHRFDLSATGDLNEAAARLFTGLRALDGTATTIAVAPIPRTGLGEAINDRLIRAAAPR